MLERARGGAPDDRRRFADDIMQSMPAGEFPHLMELITEHALRSDYDYGAEFDYGLALVLDALYPDEAVG